MSGILDLTGKVALITGGGQGVGRQAALHFAAHNAAGIIVNDFYIDRAEAVAEEIRAHGGNAMAVQANVGTYADVQRLCESVEHTYGRIDILVNNAGNAGPTGDVMDLKPFWETEPADWARFIETNLFGVFNACRGVLPGMVARRYGRIVTVISDAGRVGEAHLAVYSAAKAGAAGFSRAIAKAVGRADVTANCVSLSAVRTPGMASLLTDDAVAKMLKSYIIRRLGEPTDAANLILFLASDAASWITGQTYAVNGGYAITP